ncbi:Tripartite motif-containing protein 3 [Mactra antiquata]
MADSSVVSKCGICLSTFHEPKILPCFHTFCAKCLENNIVSTSQQYSFKCPMCRAITQIPDGGVKAFQTNFYVTSDSGFVSDVDCDVCCQPRKAKRKCLECSQNFCEQCSIVHERTTATKHHNLHSILVETPISKPLNICQNHLQEFINVCKECNTLCCSECITSLHRQHLLCSIESVAAEKREILREAVDQSKLITQEIESDVHVMQRQNEAKFIFFQSEIQRLCNQKDTLLEKIMQVFQQFEHSTSLINNQQMLKAREITEKQFKKCEVMHTAMDKSEAILESNDDVALLNTFEELTNILGANDSQLTPCVPGHRLMENIEKCTSWLSKIKASFTDLSWNEPDQTES